MQKNEKQQGWISDFLASKITEILCLLHQSNVLESQREKNTDGLIKGKTLDLFLLGWIHSKLKI